MSRTRIRNLSVSLDGFAMGEPQSAEVPFGHAGQRLHHWMIATKFWDPDGGTTFNFLEASLSEALDAARAAADGRDVRIGDLLTLARERRAGVHGR
jgi:hypothetical protein